MATAEEDLPDSKDIGGDTAALLLETVRQRDDLPQTQRDEAKKWQRVVVTLTEDEVLAAILNNKRLAELLRLHTFELKLRGVITDDVIRGLEAAIEKSLAA